MLHTVVRIETNLGHDVVLNVVHLVAQARMMLACGRIMIAELLKDILNAASTMLTLKETSIMNMNGTIMVGDVVRRGVVTVGTMMTMAVMMTIVMMPVMKNSVSLAAIRTSTRTSFAAGSMRLVKNFGFQPRKSRLHLVNHLLELGGRRSNLLKVLVLAVLIRRIDADRVSIGRIFLEHCNLVIVMGLGIERRRPMQADSTTCFSTRSADQSAGAHESARP